MVLKETGKVNSCSFLDLNIEIVDKKFKFKSYDKRSSFKFEIINYPDLSSNIPRNPSYGVFTSQLIRYCDINNGINNFINDVKALVNKLIKQNFDIQVLKSKYKRFCVTQMRRWSKFGIDIYENF